MRNEPHTVYLASDGLLHKIGITANEAEHRVRQLQSPLKRPVELLDSWHMPGEAREFERLFKGCLTHRRFSRALGEWFWTTREEIMEYTEHLLSVFDHSRPRMPIPFLATMECQKLTMLEIAAAVGVSGNTLYQHFPGGRRALAKPKKRKR